MQETKKNRTQRRCVLSQQTAVCSPTWAVPSSCSWYTNWRVPKSRINYMNAIPDLWPKKKTFYTLIKKFWADSSFHPAVERCTGSTGASSAKIKCKPLARIYFTLSVTWIPVLKLLDLFHHTFTIETLALRRQGGKTNSSNVQKRHRAYVTRFKCLANKLVGGWISMHSFHTRDPTTTNSLLHPCWIKFNDTQLLYSWGRFHFQSSGFLVSINIFTDWIFQLKQAPGFWVTVDLRFATRTNSTWAIILLNYVCNYIDVIAMTCLLLSSVKQQTIKDTFQLFAPSELILSMTLQKNEWKCKNSTAEQVEIPQSVGATVKLTCVNPGRTEVL